MNEKDYKNMIESLLFASGRFMDIETLMLLTGASGKNVLVNNIQRLKQEYEERNSPLMVVEEKDGWKLTVREQYLPLVRKIISETELPKTILETLAVIAWRAPVLQSDVVDIRHNKAYDHIAELIELGFIRKEVKGRSYMLYLADKFYEYFDVEGAKDIREVFRKVVGRPEQPKIEDYSKADSVELPDWYHQGAKFLEEDASKGSLPEDNETREPAKNSEEFNEL